MQKEPDKTEDNILEEDASNIKEKTPRNPVEEIGGFKGPEPTRYGDWEKKGRCIDF
jgi:shikimate dehydrogenase